MKKITKRDIGFFVLGLLFCFLLDLVLNWKESVQAFKDGYNDVQNIEIKK